MKPTAEHASCPREHILIAFVAGELAEGERESVVLHLEACAECAVIVAEVGRSWQARPTRSSVGRIVDASVFRPDDLVARRYEIRKLLGRGGMGEVYLAQDHELGELVALKTIATDLAKKPNTVERFKQEIRLARRVTHSHVCRLLEFGRHETESGITQCFFTMQYLEGTTLSRYLAGKRLPPDEALAIAEQLADGLQAVHAQGIVHRDIKPDNVMLVEAADGPSAAWLDFGVARADLRHGSAAASLAGTPAYLAPELLKGALASTASDLFAFGLVLRELFTGQLPFGVHRSEGRSSVVPSSSPEELWRNWPPSVCELVHECMARDPRERPPSAAIVLKRLQMSKKLLLQPPLQTTTPTSRKRGHARAQHLVVAGCAVMGLLAGLELSRASEPARRTAQVASSQPRPSLSPPSSGARASATVVVAPRTLPTRLALNDAGREPLPRTPSLRALPPKASAEPAPLLIPASSAALGAVPDFGGRR